MIWMKRFSGVLRKVMETPCMRIWGAMRRSSLERALGDFGQRGEAVTLLPAHAGELGKQIGGGTDPIELVGGELEQGHR